MRRNVTNNTTDTNHKISALEALIPTTSTRGRKRPRPGESTAQDDARALNMLNAFKARLESSSDTSNKPHNNQKPHDDTSNPNPRRTQPQSQPQPQPQPQPEPAAAADNDEEATLCDLHFIANCQSCSKWDEDAANPDAAAAAESDDDKGWFNHTLSFAKDRLGKDLTWKRKNEEELVVIDPREREKELKSGKRRDRENKIRDKDKGKPREGRW
jgi:peptidyl-prolyl cis-trans isomerase SDCCAG10